MQQHWDKLTRSGFQTFSILGRIERDATKRYRRHSVPQPSLSVSSDGSNGMQHHSSSLGGVISPQLSVSSDGSNGMQPLSPPPAFLLITPFQYPRTDRTGCNGPGISPPPWTVLAFSILGRIERDATYHDARAILDSIPFSILGRIERDATMLSGEGTLPGSSFQYPRTDRTGCNDIPALSSNSVRHPFSILGRIERDATW